MSEGAVLATPRLEGVRCPLCGAQESRRLVEGKDRLMGVPGAFAIAECGKCSFLFTNPRPLVEDLGLCYPPGYGPHRDVAERSGPRVLSGSGSRALASRLALAQSLGYRHLQPEGELPWSVKLRAKLRAGRLRKRIEPWRGEGRYLDAGCGSGGLLQKMQSLGWTVSGIEFTEEAAAKARAVTPALFVGDILDAPFPESSFDLVTCNHVLEHVPRPLETLAKLIRWLAPGGVLSLEVPNAGGLGPPLFGSCWFSYDLPRHLLHFTPRTLTQAVEQSGGKVISIHHVASPSTWRKSLEYQSRERTTAGRGAGLPGLLASRPLRGLLRLGAQSAAAMGRGEAIRALIQRA